MFCVLTQHFGINGFSPSFLFQPPTNILLIRGECWIVDPIAETIEASCHVYHMYWALNSAPNALIPDLRVDVALLFAD